jgi:glycerate dehydrogenase
MLVIINKIISKENDLRESLDTGKVAYTAVDVLYVEPPSADNPLLGTKNCIITPHIAWAPIEAEHAF